MNNLLSRLNPKSFILVGSIGLLAQDHKVKAYLVGGSVRDLILKKSNIDLDITVEAPYKPSGFKGTENIAIRLADSLADLYPGSQVTRYPAFKTATVLLPDGCQIDLATARRETYAKGGAFPAVKPSTLKADLLRRDFTINAMAVAINPKAWGKLIDPFAGKKDLQAKRIRILHAKSFLDDPTRILRAARFKARLKFSIEAKTMRSLRSAIKIKVLDTIKPQRYLKDFNKILKEPRSLEAIKYLRSWNAYKE